MSYATLQVLKVLLENPMEDHYGFELVQTTGLQSGSIYPILTRLEEHGWLESHWENIDESEYGRKKRRYYCLTDLGRLKASEELEGALQKLGLAAGGGQAENAS